ncbi:hypothetical protein A2U01_0098711, partial [Trifolium medium]|nr:hypothetical protein [Trifolium medium]
SATRDREAERQAELDAIIHEAPEVDGQRTTTFVTSMLDIRQLIRVLMASGDIPQESRPYRALQQIERNTHFFHQYR